ncbi:NAD-glutamate dehydrogenase [Gordonia amicalis]|uniref:NAD-glutamate dehydrogenase domain-containing protein n=1 Tax=Gordonia TaxID=2053 RepID=UPI00177B6F98|nr:MULTISPECIES: NAD-glutamate dehydrogenase domain-containing protein [Gordonia]UPW12169.1 NAD-glutamate dehydrogenase [Gordonia amicalis]
MTSTLPPRHDLLPTGYVEEQAHTAAPEVAILEALTPDTVEVGAKTTADGHLQVTLYSGGPEVSFEKVILLLRSLDLQLVDHATTVVRRPDGLRCRLHAFVASPGRVAGAGTDDAAVLDVFSAMWSGRTEPDRFGHLVLTAGLGWREVVVLRAYARYLQQTALPYGQRTIESVVTGNPDVASAIVELFGAQFDPGIENPARSVDLVAGRLGTLDALIDRVQGLDADRIFRAYRSLVLATSRTNFYRPDALGPERPQLAFKLRPREVDILPPPRPLHEIFVYSPDVEGVHLRFGAVARGGIRWSDRRDDYRTEILGLAKAQTVKNSVIVPAGAKGGFVVKNPAMSGEDGYRQFISGLLDLTDNRSADGRSVHPDATVCGDGEDSYLVVAADKGTARFSDVANGIAVDRGFWLGDAFASGGSVGYDHKAMGITARGAWVSVTRHLAELGIDVDRDTFTVAGIGDMSGDVFGNGMLSTPRIRLVAAFDHRHIFIDPDPNADRSFEERGRLFGLPSSSWADYRRELISTGGGVFDRTAKSISVSPEAAEVLGLPRETTDATPQELISAILCAPVDLLWNGGVGTYVKSAAENHDQVGDRTNDLVRVDATMVRARVIGEGGNLGVTSAGRIEFARNGGRINTDALDNSAGVDCSDHEVNIKILLDGRSSTGVSGARRGEVLAELTDEVADLVLRNNWAQNRILGEARAHAAQMVDVHARLVEDLERRRGLDRALETLPTAEGFAALARRGEGLSSPELATLMGHAKLDVKTELCAATGAFDDPYFSDRLTRYFPQALADLGDVDDFPLRTEVIATELVNDLFAFGGLTFAFRLREETGAAAADIVRAFVVAVEVLGLAELQSDIEAAGLRPEVEYEIIAEARRLLDRASRWLLTRRPQPIPVTQTIERFRIVRDSAPQVSIWLRGDEAARIESAVAQYTEAGVPPAIARRVAEGLYRYSVLDIAEVAEETGCDIATVGAVYFALSDHIDVDRWLIRLSALPRGDRWHALARSALRDDLYRALRDLTCNVVGTLADDPVRAAAVSYWPTEAIEAWELSNQTALQRATVTLGEIEAAERFDLATLAVAARHIRSVADGR